MYKICVLAVSLILVSFSLGNARTARALDESPLEEARERVARAASLFDQEDYAAALAELERVLELLGSHPSRAAVLHNIGQCHERMFEYDEALRYYHLYLEEAGPDAPEREGVRATIRTLESLLATLQIRANVDRTEIWLDGRRVGTAPIKLRVPSGRHVIEGRAAGRANAAVEVLVAAGNTRAVSLELPAIQKVRRVPKSLFFSVAGAAAASLAAGATLGAFTLRQRADLRARLRDDDTRFEVDESDRDALERRALVTDALLVSGGVLTVSAVVLYYFADFAPARAHVQLGVDHTGMSLSGSF